MVAFTRELSRKTEQHPLGGRREIVKSVVYRLAPNPYRIYSRWELPSSYELEDHESEEDSWIRQGSHFYNLNEFCTVGMPHLPGPMGGAQLAAGDFMIAGYQGEVYRVTWSETFN